MSDLPLHFQFSMAMLKSQIPKMSHEQLQGFAQLLVDRIYTQEMWIQAVNQDCIQNNRPLPFVPLDPGNFNPPA